MNLYLSIKLNQFPSLLPHLQMKFGDQTTEAGREQLKKLNKEVQDRRNLNKKLRDLLADNQKVAEETSKDLER